MAQGALIYTECFTDALENNKTVYVKTSGASVVGKVQEVFADGVSIKQEASDRVYSFKFQDIFVAQTK